MYTTSSYFSVSWFRHRVVAWLLLTVFSLSFAPAVSMAQQPTATVQAFSGTVLVSGQAAAVGSVLQPGDSIQTQAGASVVLELSDGTELRLGEKTQINVRTLTQTAAGAKISTLNLLAGRLRALLSLAHQQEGSAFTVETPNAQIGAKFSQPDIEVVYDPDKQETIGIAHTVALTATNLLTGETKLVPVGATVIISGLTIKIVAGIVGAIGSSGGSSSGAVSSGGGASGGGTSGAGTSGTGASGAGTSGTGSAASGASGTSSSGSGSSGMGTGTKVAIGVGAAAAVGGGIALAAGSGGGEDSNSGDESDSDDDSVGGSFTGIFKVETNFVYPGSTRREFWTYILNLTQSENSITGSLDITVRWENCCTINIFLPVTGSVINERSATLSWPSERKGCSCESNPTERYETGGGLGGTFTATLENNGQNLQVEGFEYIRQ